MSIPLPVLQPTNRLGAVKRSAEEAESLRERTLELGAEGEWIVHRVPPGSVEVSTRSGAVKRVPLAHTWHHKSCGQCGHIPGYSTSIFWLHRKLGLDYHDPRDQTSCTAWNYYASATSNQAAQAAVAMRNFAAAYETGYYPQIHCATSYGHYKEVRHELVHQPALREQVRGILGKMGKPLVMPEEIVHYSEWVYAVRHEIARRRVLDLSGITVTVHPACHYYKLVQEDAIYDPEIYGGQRTAVVTAVAEALGARVGDYSTWFDCCGFGFRHILVQRDFSRSFAVQRKIEQMREEVDPDVTLTHDTGCVTTLDKSQFAPQVHRGVKAAIPVLSEAQFCALAMGAHPYRVCQLHWHAADYRPLLEKLGIDWKERWREFEDDLRRLEANPGTHLTWKDADGEWTAPVAPRPAGSR
jgi:heterodisulfide reductase subunit B